LGSQGANAVGELIRMLNDPTHPDTAIRAAMVLRSSSYGNAGVAPLTAAVKNQQLARRVRYAAAGGLGFRDDGRTPLRQVLTNSDPVVRSVADRLTRYE